MWIVIMKLRQSKKNKKIIISAIDNKEIFKHCTNGSNEITEELFKSEILILLKIHINDIISIYDKNDNLLLSYYF